MDTRKSLIANGLLTVEEECGAIVVTVDVGLADGVRDVIATVCKPDSWSCEHNAYVRKGTSFDPGEWQPASDKIRVFGMQLSEFVEAFVQGLRAKYDVEQRSVREGLIEVQLYHVE